MKNKIKITELAGADIHIVGDVSAHCKLSKVESIRIDANVLPEIIAAASRDKYFGDMLKEMMEYPEFTEIMKEIQERK